ncbi:hypothetical protein PtA15_7A486 [Puccinia triticina]|uniref:Uncharacterized protein n=1 Tax=Puccinia triticina TaxID=208348 RepID=A0ABY7CVL8_9BASI|nr:uncharacterized protein PtA15_7A486 [Puccinia triticina]WAQ86757.1 hypothetical protein PtA15_7A486 [Puccinia triticina]
MCNPRRVSRESSRAWLGLEGGADPAGAAHPPLLPPTTPIANDPTSQPAHPNRISWPSTSSPEHGQHHPACFHSARLARTPLRTATPHYRLPIANSALKKALIASQISIDPLSRPLTACLLDHPSHPQDPSHSAPYTPRKTHPPPSPLRKKKK